MAKTRIKMVSHFPAAKKQMWKAVESARDHALDVGEDEAEARIERVNNSRGYNLPADIEQEKTGFQSGLIRHPDWFMKFFEYGTVYIPASPFMRPAHRKMKKAFVDQLGEDAPRFTRRAAVR